MDYLMGESSSIQTSLQSAGRVSLMEQPAEERYVFHLLYVSPIKRGHNAIPKWNLPSVEAVEDIPTLADTQVSLRTPKAISSVRLAPSGEAIDFNVADGRIHFVVPKLECHQMIELSYA